MAMVDTESQEFKELVKKLVLEALKEENNKLSMREIIELNDSIISLSQRQIVLRKDTSDLKEKVDKLDKKVDKLDKKVDNGFIQQDKRNEDNNLRLLGSIAELLGKGEKETIRAKSKYTESKKDK